jgi:hypothetical protein
MAAAGQRQEADHGEHRRRHHGLALDHRQRLAQTVQLTGIQEPLSRPLPVALDMAARIAAVGTKAPDLSQVKHLG